MKIVSSDQKHLVSSVEDWHKFAPPKEPDRQWKEGRSAMELAKAWFRPSMPGELQALFESHPLTSGFTLVSGTPEKVTKLDTYPGEQRNHDMVLTGTSPYGNIVICIEAKVDEPFGNSTIAKYHQAKLNTPSNAPKRITELCSGLFNCAPTDARLGDLQYQLLTAIGGTILEAFEQQADIAVFVVYEFAKYADTNKAIVNDKAFDDFVHALPGLANIPISTGTLIGPVVFTNWRGGTGKMPLLIGKVQSYK